jgi:putative tricarboxylic transport membrane protein
MTNERAVSWRPQRPIELVAGTPPGGGQDRPARVLVEVIERLHLLEYPVHVVNMPGKGGGAAWDHLREYPGDAHRLAINSPPLLTNRLTGVSDYDHRQLTPIATLYTEYVGFFVQTDSPVASAAGMQETLGKDPGALTVSLATALGTSNHIALAAVAAQAGGDPHQLRIRVFDSARQAVADMLAGHSHVAAVSTVSALPELEQGRLRALALTAPQRLAGMFAHTPTFAELGIDCVIGTWRGVIAPADLTPEQVVFWETTLRKATADAGWREQLARQYWIDMFLGAGETRDFLDQERASLATALQAMGSDPIT